MSLQWELLSAKKFLLFFFLLVYFDRKQTIKSINYPLHNCIYSFIQFYPCYLIEGRQIYFITLL